MKRFLLSALAVAVVAGFLSSTATSSAQEQGLPRFLRIRNGDINGDGSRDISDMIAGLQWLFSGGPSPVNPEGDDPAAERLAAIQKRAGGILANLPTEEQITKLPRRFRRGFLKVRKVFASAAVNAANWSPKDLRHYANSVSWVGEYLSTAAVALSDFNPRILDPNCIPGCVAEHDECPNGCPEADVELDDEILGPLDSNMECNMECDLKLADCIARCGNWGLL